MTPSDLTHICKTWPQVLKMVSTMETIPGATKDVSDEGTTFIYESWRAFIPVDSYSASIHFYGEYFMEADLIYFEQEYLSGIERVAINPDPNAIEAHHLNHPPRPSDHTDIIEVPFDIGYYQALENYYLNLEYSA